MNSAPPKRPLPRKDAGYEQRLVLLALASGFPALAVALWFLWSEEASPSLSLQGRSVWTGFLVACWLGFAFALRERVRFPLRTLSNLLAGFREGDFSTRARGARMDDALGEVITEVNALGATLRAQRLGALEATALLRTVMEEIEVAVFTFDSQQRLRLVNRAGERLLARSAEQLLGRTAGELGLADSLQGEPARTAQMTFPGGMGRWAIRRSNFRQGGLPHQLLVLTDLSRALRDEERQAWQRIVRVIGHEINNSLAPIKSIGGSLASLISRQPRPEDWEEDMRSGLNVIASRAESLSRFMEAYARLARLPAPVLHPVEIGDRIKRAASLETRLAVAVREGPGLTLQADGDQLEQMLINLVRNAVDAVLEHRKQHPASAAGGVTIGWSRLANCVEVTVEDDGPGLSNTANLFVPFFTTKPGGSGIGLVLCRQIAEAHGGSLALENRTDTRGCRARLRLPA